MAQGRSCAAVCNHYCAMGAEPQCGGRDAAAQPGHTPIEERAMSWKAPKVVEIALGAEINSYACAEAKK